MQLLIIYLIIEYSIEYNYGFIEEKRGNGYGFNQLSRK